MDKRNKFWRRQQMARVFKARMVLYAAYGHCIIREDGSYYEHPHWFELAKDKWAQVYKTTDRKSTRLNSSHTLASRMPSSA